MDRFRTHPTGRSLPLVHGRLLRPVRGLQFSGVDRRVLRDIMANGRVANPIEMLDSSGTSERFTLGEASGVPVSWSVPPVLIAEMDARQFGGAKNVSPNPHPTKSNRLPTVGPTPPSVGRRHPQTRSTRLKTALV